MPIEHRHGDLFRQPDLDALAHGANCRAVMGRGIALEFRRRWPAMFDAYAAACRSGEFALGGFLPWRTLTGRWVYNLATQDRPGRYADLAAIDSSLRLAVAHAEEHFVDTIGLPEIGAGIGGLTWPDVEKIVEAVAEDTPVRLVVVSLPVTR